MGSNFYTILVRITEFMVEYDKISQFRDGAYKFDRYRRATERKGISDKQSSP